MKDEEIVKKYFELKYSNRIQAILELYKKTNDKTIDLSKEITEIKKKHSVTKNHIKNELIKNDIDYETAIDLFSKKYEQYDNYYKIYYSYTRSFFFSDPKKLINWFMTQNNSCGYCGIRDDELKEIVEKRGGKLTLNGLTKRSKGTLEIERLKPTDSKTIDFGYTIENCILTCPLCNNAKSNLIDENGWRVNFALPMRNYYENILNKQLLNTIPKKTKVAIDKN